jgi:hypothetical protein
MQPIHHKKTHLKHPHLAKKKDKDKGWMRNFWIGLVTFFAVSAVSVAYYSYEPTNIEIENDSYVSISTSTVAGDDKNVTCQLSLLIDSEQDEAIQKRKPELEVVVKSALSELYQEDQRPDLQEVREKLFYEINKKLPRKLKIREVYIQEMLIGQS